MVTKRTGRRWRDTRRDAIAVLVFELIAVPVALVRGIQGLVHPRDLLGFQGRRIGTVTSVGEARIVAVIFLLGALLFGYGIILQVSKLRRMRRSRRG